MNALLVNDEVNIVNEVNGTNRVITNGVVEKINRKIIIVRTAGGQLAKFRKEDLKQVGYEWPGQTQAIQPLPKGHEIIFHEGNVEHRRKLDEFSDRGIETALNDLEDELKRFLPTDHRTGFPSFTVYRDGVEIGGG